MHQSSRRLAIASLLCCVIVCACLLALMLTNRSTRELLERGEVGEWAVGYVWMVSPYVVLSILSALFRNSQFFSWWILACVVIATVTNQALYYLLFEGGNNTGVAMAMGLGSLFTWIELGVLLAVGVVVRVVLTALQRPK